MAFITVSFLMIWLTTCLVLFGWADAVDAGAMTNGSCLIQTARVARLHRSSSHLWSEIHDHIPGGAVEVPHGQTWVLDHPMDVESLTVRGTLEWDTSQEGLQLKAGYVVVDNGGHLKVGTRDRPMERSATIYIKDNGLTHPELGKRVLGGMGTAKVEIHGRQLRRTWTLLSRTAYAGSMQLFLKDDPESMGWRVGDRIGVATTTRGESSIHTIASIGPPTPEPPSCPKMPDVMKTCSPSRCKVLVTHMWAKTCRQYCARSGLQCVAAHEEVNDDCNIKANITCDQTFPGTFDLLCECHPPPQAEVGPNVKVLHLDTPLRDEHWGGHRDVMGMRLEMAAEVVNLERSVLITGDHDDFETSHEGLHTIKTGTGYWDVRYARVEYCGQRDQMGRYCMHFHRMSHCPQCVIEGNAIVESTQIGITIHGTHDTLVSNNVIWNGRANGIYTEDGNEMNNLIKQNVIICSWWQTCSITWQQNSGLHAGIFMIGMTNDLIENRVAGHENCIWTPGGSRGNGHGAAFTRTCPMHVPFGQIRGNVNHDCQRFGLYLDNQMPRNLVRDDDGMVSDMASCGKFTADGKDNGLQPANVVYDEFDWHNMYVGQYNMGDVQYVNFTSVNNYHSMYWKSSKNFADGRLWHVKDSAILNDPTDAIGNLQFLGPGGPHVFAMQNTIFAGGPVGRGALCAGQHCGLGSAGGPCDSQYLLENVDFTRVLPGQKRIEFGAHSSDAGEVLPMFMTRDNSLAGFRSIVSSHLDGFANLPGCSRMNHEWANAIGCSVDVRRFNVWGLDSGDLTIQGPGYHAVPDDSAPTHGMNAGRMLYEPQNGKGYGTPVIVGERYELSSPSGTWNGDMVMDFSDPELSAYFGNMREEVTVAVGTSQCQLRGSDDRRYLSHKGFVPEVLPTHTRIEGNELLCAISPPTPLSLLQHSPCADLLHARASCSDDSCKVLVRAAHRGSCDLFCTESERACTGAWEAADSSCRAKASLPCNATVAEADLICECSSDKRPRTQQ